MRAAVEETARALVEHTRARVWEPDVGGREVVLAEKAYLVFRLHGQVWTEILAHHWLSWKQEAEAQALSELLGTRAIAYWGSDTAGA